MYFICTIICLNVLLGVLNHCPGDRAIQVGYIIAAVLFA